MTEKKNLRAMIDADLHARVCEERDKAGLTNGGYVTELLTEYYEWKDKGGKQIMETGNEKTRTLAFQVSENLFQRIKKYLERESVRTGRKVTQREFVIGLIEDALAESETADDVGTDANAETDGTDAGNAYNEPETETPEYADGTIPEDGSEPEEPDEADTDGESDEN